MTFDKRENTYYRFPPAHLESVFTTPSLSDLAKAKLLADSGSLPPRNLLPTRLAANSRIFIRKWVRPPTRACGQPPFCFSLRSIWCQVVRTSLQCQRLCLPQLSIASTMVYAWYLISSLGCCSIGETCWTHSPITGCPLYSNNGGSGAGLAKTHRSYMASLVASWNFAG